jgi:hypothetical protein
MTSCHRYDVLTDMEIGYNRENKVRVFYCFMLYACTWQMETNKFRHVQDMKIMFFYEIVKIFIYVIFIYSTL